MNVSDIGKSIYLWLMPTGMQPAQAADQLKAAGFQSVILHATSSIAWRTRERMALVEELRRVGIIPIGSAAVYGDNPRGEGLQAAAICEEFKLPAFSFDAEARFDEKPQANSNAVHLLRAFREAAPAGTLAGWTWWARYQAPKGGTWHDREILRAAMAPGYGDADWGTPMMYWETSLTSAVELFDQSLTQWRKITSKPIVPAGRAYNGDGGTATPEAVNAFYERVRAAGLPGVTWWAFSNAWNIPSVWQALAAHPVFGDAPAPPAELTLEEKVDILWKEYQARTKNVYLPVVGKGGTP